MRTLVLTRGAMGAGKSYWIRQNGLSPFTLSADEIRLLFQSPYQTPEGKETISGRNDQRVWQFLHQRLEERMQRGEFTIIDATHAKPSAISQYKKLAQEYRYRVYIVDFTDVPMSVALERNKERPQYKQVPELKIENAYARFEHLEPQGWVTVVKPNEFFDVVMKNKLIDYSHYKKIHHIGDIHGCWKILENYFQDGLKDDELYIFLGDFCDRGIKNAEVLEFLISIMDKKNVIFLEGNHEIHLWNWANDKEVRSREFRYRTAPALEASGIDKKDVRQLYRKCWQLVSYKYHDKEVLVTHGGIAKIGLLQLTATEQFIKGVGGYEINIDQSWIENTNTAYQIHGHRNIQRYPVQVNERCFNLEGQVEMGGHLRIVTLDESGFTTIELKNDEIHPMFVKRDVEVPKGNINLLEELRNNKLVVEKKYGNISSFNFANKVFYDRLWDENNVKARGLFINTDTKEIVARSYDKFFNIGERKETTLESLANRFRFPVNVYVKENGYLGMVGYDSQSDQLVFASKSAIGGDFANKLEELFMDRHGIIVDSVKEYVKKHNATLVFEVIDPVFDPHIIEYDRAHLVLLDIVYRDQVYHKANYEEVKRFSSDFQFECKKLWGVLENWDSFYSFYNLVMDESNVMHDTEGFVLEDDRRFMTKLKLPYYSFWKKMRSIKDKVASCREIDMAWLYTPLANKFYAWCKKQDPESLKTDIITLRKAFDKSRN